MRIAKPQEQDIESVRQFTQTCELFLERQKFSFNSPEDGWEDLDDDDDDKIAILKFRKQLAANEDLDEDKIDNRILAYEFLKQKYAHRLSHILLTAEVLLENCCDPTDTCLAFHPSLYQNHVEPEQ